MVVGGGEEVHRHVSAAAEGGLELFEGEEDFAVVGSGVVGGFDVDGAGEAVVLAGGEVGCRRGRGCGRSGRRRGVG